MTTAAAVLQASCFDSTNPCSRHASKLTCQLHEAARRNALRRLWENIQRTSSFSSLLGGCILWNIRFVATVTVYYMNFIIIILCVTLKLFPPFRASLVPNPDRYSSLLEPCQKYGASPAIWDRTVLCRPTPMHEKVDQWVVVVKDSAADCDWGANRRVYLPHAWPGYRSAKASGCQARGFWLILIEQRRVKFVWTCRRHETTPMVRQKNNPLEKKCYISWNTAHFA